MKRINLDELTDDQSLVPNAENLDLLGAVAIDQNGEGQGKEVNGVQAEITKPLDDTKVPVTLESLSNKIDQILGYLATNKSEVLTINNRHEKWFKILAGAYNEVADRVDLS